MAEVQTNTNTGEMAQRFIEFIMMQAQNAALFLGQIPNPQSGQGEVNLELAKMFIDQLAMIQEKKRGNLSNEEAAVLKNTIANLQMAFVEVSQEASGAKSAAAPEPPPATPEAEPSSTTSPAGEPPPLSVESEGESRKKFTKSYGA